MWKIQKVFKSTNYKYTNVYILEYIRQKRIKKDFYQIW